MSERRQHTAATTRATMQRRYHTQYDEGLHHKHDKWHLPYRAHCPSHPVAVVQLANGLEQLTENSAKKFRLRIVKHHVH